MKRVLPLLLVVGGVLAQTEKSAPFTSYQKYVREQGRTRPVLVNNLDAFVSHILKLTQGAPFMAYEYLGFSGAGYKDLHQFKEDFQRTVVQAYETTKKRYGPSAKIVFLLGGTTDGFGVGYSIIAELIAQKQFNRHDVIVGGLVSDAAVKYHLEGVEKGWGDVISPDQDVLLLLDVYKEPGQDESWELRTEKNGTSATVDVLTKLFAAPNAHGITMELFEGGAIAEKEALEFVQYWSDRVVIATKSFPRLVLRTGYLPKKPAKLTTTPAATALAANPYVQTKSYVFKQPAGSSAAAPLRDIPQGGKK